MSEREKPPIKEKLVTPDDRRLVVDAFNKYYFSVYKKYEGKPRVYYDSYLTLKSSVESATTSEIVDPEHAIPAGYEKDGSSVITFQTEGERDVTRREGIPMDFFDGYTGAGKAILEANSRPFLSAHPENYEDRVRLEAELSSQNRKNVVGSDNRSQHVKQFVAVETLKRRRVLSLPVVGDIKTTPEIRKSRWGRIVDVFKRS